MFQTVSSPNCDDDGGGGGGANNLLPRARTEQQRVKPGHMLSH